MKRFLSVLTLSFALISFGADFCYSQIRGQRDARLEEAFRALKKAQDDSSQPVHEPIETHPAEEAASAEPEPSTVDPSAMTPSPLNPANTAPYVPGEGIYPHVFDTTRFHPMWNEEINLAVILPFNLEASNAEEERKQSRSVEFYQGLLLAVDQFQRIGQRIKVQAYDLGTRSLESILADSALAEANAIVAPFDSLQIAQVAAYGMAKDLPVLSPFTFCQSLVEGYPSLFQLVTPQSAFYDQLGESLLEQFFNFRFVFVSDSLCQTQVDPCPAHLKQMLIDREIPFDEYIYNEPQSVICMDSALNLFDKHVLYILETPQKTALQRFFPNLKNKLFLDANPAVAEALGAATLIGNNSVTIEELVPDSLFNDSVQLITEERQVAVLGYPSWQLYMNDFMDSFYDLNVWMFSKFYANPFDDAVQDFYNDFRFWFNREVQSLYPKYGVLGYDVATYMLTKLQQCGTLMADGPDDAPITTLQTPIRFEQKDGGCYVNRSFYLVHFTPDAIVEKIEIQ